MGSISPAQRIGIFVDVQNMFYSAYDCFRGRLNYKRVLETAVADRQLVRAIAYAMHDGNNQNSFFTMLREVGFELRTKEPRVRPDGSRKGGWDIGMAIEAITLAPRLDVVVLVTGDGDFVDLVHALRRSGVRVEVYAFERNAGRELREAADLFVAIGEDLIFRESHVDAPVEAPAARPAAEPPRQAPVGARPAPAASRPAAEPAASTSSHSVGSFGAGLLNDVDDEKS